MPQVVYGFQTRFWKVSHVQINWSLLIIIIFFENIEDYTLINI